MRRRPCITRREAEDQVEAERWQCKSCTAPADEDDSFCISCRMYWNDVRDGLFDRDYDASDSI